MYQVPGIGNSLAPDDEDEPGRRDIENDSCDDCNDRPEPHGVGFGASRCGRWPRAAVDDEPMNVTRNDQ